ncbi:MAG: branched-chain amino acid ABC transporter permease [Polyangiales bacterium]
MEQLLHQIASGLATGGVYASLALALVMIYQATHHVNFAQGELAMCSTYLAWSLVNKGAPYWLAFLVTVTVSFGVGVGIERVLIRKVEKASVLTVVIVFIGMQFILNSVAGWIFGYTIQTFPSPFPEAPPFDNPYINSHELGIVGVTFLVVVLLWAFFRFTSAGLALRGAAANAESAALCGIRVGSMLALGWGLASAIGAVAGMLIAPVVFLDPNMMSGILIYAFAAALLGGIDSPVGAVVGGFSLGVLENLAGAYLIGTELKLTVALVTIIAVLVVRPSGLFGKVVVTRV